MGSLPTYNLHQINGPSAEERTLAQLDEAVYLIDVHRKRAYNEALRVCPHLVETESNPFNFLAFEKHNFWSAAERLVAYWQRRYEVFGSKCFLPLDLSGKGALDEEDIIHIKKGCDVITSNDVIFLFHDAISDYEPTTVKLRRSFFFMQQFMNLPTTSAREVGMNFVSVDRGYDRSGNLRRGNLVFYEMVHSAFPLRVKAVHCMVFHTVALTFLQSVLPSLGRGPWSALSKIHHCSLPSDAMEKLVPHGVFPSSIPDSLGGVLDLHSHYVCFLLANKLPPTASSFSGVLRTDDLETMRVLCTLTDGSDGLNMLPTGRFRDMIFGNPFHAEKSLARSSTGHARLHGSDGLIHELSKLDEAIALLPATDKEAYLEAQRKCPELIQRESNPANILRLEKFYVWRTARRITTYWRNRVRFFGRRAFLPLTLSGALQPEDVVALSSGHLMVPGTDKWGRTLVYIDASKDGYPSLESRLRAAFYVQNLNAQNPRHLEDGYVGVFVHGGSPDKDMRPWKASWNPFVDKFVMDVLSESFSSVTPTTAHFVSCSEDKQNFFSQVFPLVCKAFGKVFNSTTQYHVGDSVQELATKFEKLGIGKDCLPVTIGGVVDGKTFICRRTECEGGYLVPSTTNSFIGTANNLPPNELPVNAAAAGLDQLQEALDRIPSQDKEALLEAVNNYPQLFEKESELSRFLRFADSDAHKAASALVEYWKIRKEIFGDRAFLPMNQTGDGALDRKDITVLQSGCFMQLPCDSNGRVAIYCDGSKIQTSTRQSELRCAFYVFSIMAENKMIPLGGYQLLYFVTQPMFDNAMADCLSLVLQCIPVRLKHFHMLLVHSNQKAKVSSFWNGKLEEVARNLPAVSRDFVVEHIGYPRGDVADRLKSYGFVKAGLPKSLGGEWGVEEFIQWQELRVRYEWDLPISGGTRGIADRLHIPTNGGYPKEVTGPQSAERKRRLRVVHARRKRERERLRNEALQEQATELRDENQRLKEEGIRLQDLIVQAKTATRTCVHTHLACGEPLS